MKSKKQNAAIVGVGAAACAVCCAGPVIGFLAAIGLTAAAGFALFGTIGVVLGALFVTVVLIRRRRGAVTWAPADATAPVPVTMGGRARS